MCIKDEVKGLANQKTSLPIDSCEHRECQVCFNNLVILATH